MFSHHGHGHGQYQPPATGPQHEPTFKIFCRADEGYCLTVRHDAVVLAPTNPREQHWYKDMRHSTRVKDEEGHPAFALVNRATGLAVKHSLGQSHPVSWCRTTQSTRTSRCCGPRARTSAMASAASAWSTTSTSTWTPSTATSPTAACTTAPPSCSGSGARATTSAGRSSPGAPRRTRRRRRQHTGTRHTRRRRPTVNLATATTPHLRSTRRSRHRATMSRATATVHRRSDHPVQGTATGCPARWRRSPPCASCAGPTRRTASPSGTAPSALHQPIPGMTSRQHWVKDMRHSTSIKDEEGYPAFALVNKATGEAIKHSLGQSHPVVRLVPYNPEYLDESVLWTESKDVGHGFRCVRMVNNIYLNFDAFHGDKDHGGVHDGTTVVLWEWCKGDNQRWKILPWCK
uniref:R40c1 protein n=1 Tax=Oryza sativa subsp. japonica TaxID=39947 RepID=Q6Z4N7_ORYSJ|nr:putative r40c1 protein [Oryza sativa Japonica Group]